jgi:N-acetylmuramoyl-L-alanine amidase
MIEADTALVTHLTPSPNFGERKEGCVPEMIILHYTGMEDGAHALARLCDALCEVSAHYVIEENGDIHQLVPEMARAWHAGISAWRGKEDINSRSIGIEIVNGGHDFRTSKGELPPYPNAQIKAVIALCRDISERWSIPSERILAHSDIAPTRKQDPGEHFPWQKLYEAGVGHWVSPTPLNDGRFFSLGDVGQPIEALQTMLSLYGYPLEVIGVFDGQTQAVITAFQRHFRVQRVDGVADTSTITTLHRLLKALSFET